MSKLSIIRELWDYLKERKLYWLTPIILVLIILSVLMMLSQGAATTPFIYTIF